MLIFSVPVRVHEQLSETSILKKLEASGSASALSFLLTSKYIPVYFILLKIILSLVLSLDVVPEARLSLLNQMFLVLRLNKEKVP